MAAALALLAVLATAMAARADDQRTVQAGQSIVLVTSEKPLADKSGTLKGSVTIVQNGGTPPIHTLIYTAPKEGGELSETVAYSDGADHTVLISVSAASNQPTLTDSAIYVESFKALFELFIIAVLLESGLAVLFNWRPFLVLFDARGVRTVVSVLFAYFFVHQFELDIVTWLVNVYSEKDYGPSVAGKALTALILAGGSGGVNNILVAFGYRSVKTAEQVTPRPPKTEGWISVTLTRKDAIGPVSVLVGGPAKPPVAGTIAGTSKRSAFTRFFLRDPMRFPMSGGYAVPAGAEYAVQLAGFDANGNVITCSWGPYPIAAGAVLDLNLTL